MFLWPKFVSAFMILCLFLIDFFARIFGVYF